MASRHEIGLETLLDKTSVLDGELDIGLADIVEDDDDDYIAEQWAQLREKQLAKTAAKAVRSRALVAQASSASASQA